MIEAGREFLLDIGMFANSFGGILLIGVPERRDEQGQPTGAPDLLRNLRAPDGTFSTDTPE